MNDNEFMTIPQLAQVLGVSRISVYKQVMAGKIKAKKAGRMYLISRADVQGALGHSLTEARKEQIAKAVKRTVSEYGEVLKKLGSE